MPLRIEDMQPLLATILAGLTLCHAAAALGLESDLPVYNVKRYCQTESDRLGNDASMLKFCLEQEQQSYDELKNKWSSLGNKIKYYCQQRPDLRSYYKLKVCTDREFKEAKELRKFKFRR
jgi:hypothetical protein